MALGGCVNTCKSKSAAVASAAAVSSSDIGFVVMIDGEEPFGFFSSAPGSGCQAGVDLVNEGGRRSMEVQALRNLRCSRF